MGSPEGASHGHPARLFSRPAPSPESLKEELQGTRRTVRLGEHLHVVAVTAKPLEADRPLTPGTVYFYNLFFSVAEVSRGSGNRR